MAVKRRNKSIYISVYSYTIPAFEPKNPVFPGIFVSIIYSSQIKALKIDEKHICHISGNGNISQPEWAGTSRKREDVEVKSFSFLLDFEDTKIEEILRKWVHL